MYKKCIILLIISMFHVLTIWAQELTIKEIQVTNDLSASRYRRNDLNGQPCALIKVQLATSGATFEGNVIKPVEYKAGEYWVYISKGTKELMVKHPSFLPLHINIADHGIEYGVQPLTTYRLTLVMPQTYVPIQTQKLTINFTPADAIVVVDSKTYTGNGRVELILPVGSHDYQIVAAGYDSAEGSVKLIASQPRIITEHLATTSEVTTVQQPTTQVVMQQMPDLQDNITKPKANSERAEIGVLGSSTMTLMNEQSTTNNNLDVLGAKFQVITDSQKKQLGIKYGLQITKLNVGKLKDAGIKQGFFIKSVNDEPINTLNDLQEIVKSTLTSKKKVLYIQGVFPTGKKAFFAVPLED